MTIEQWGNFAVLVGGASAALTGLLFVAVSLNLKRIAASPLLREAAAKTLIVLLTPPLITILIAIPGQTTRLLGLELVAMGLLTGALSIIVRDQPESADERERARLYRVVPPNLVTVLILVAGLAIWGRRAGAGSDTLLLSTTVSHRRMSQQTESVDRDQSTTR
jgi:modulator of FtsH protease